MALLMSCAMPLAIWPSARSRSCCSTRHLRLAQVVVGPLQGDVQAGLVAGERHVFAELPQEFAFGAAEGLRRLRARTPARRTTSFSTTSGATTSECRPAAAKRRGNGRWHVGDFRFVDQLSAHAARRAHPRPPALTMPSARPSCGQVHAAGGADPRHGQRAGGAVMGQRAVELGAEIGVEAVQHHLQDALDVLAFAHWRA